VTRARAPSGEQIEIVSGDQTAVVVEAGGGCGRTRRAATRCSTASRSTSSSREAAASCSSPGRIHGLGRWVTWSVAQREPHRVVMRLPIDARPGYPFSLTVEVEYRLSDEGLGVTTTTTDVGAAACPYGCGAHPFLTLSQSIDALSLRSPARTVLMPDERGIPVSTEAVEGREFDFRTPRPIGTTQLDHAFGDLERDPDGLARVILSGAGRELSLWADESYGYLMLFTGDTLAQPRRSLAVEPMTCPPAERLPDGRGADPAGAGRLVHLQLGDRTAATSASVTSRVPASPPRSGVRTSLAASTSSVARMTAAAASASPRSSSIIDRPIRRRSGSLRPCRRCSARTHAPARTFRARRRPG
jgi:aldose 1-epimerase